MKDDLKEITRVIGYADNQSNPEVAQVFAQIAMARAMVALCDRLDNMTVEDKRDGTRVLQIDNAFQQR